MAGPAFLRGERVTLRPVEGDDARFVQRGRNDPDLRLPLGFEGPQNRSAVESGIEESGDSDESFSLLVCLDDEPVGEVLVEQLDFARPMIAYWIVPEHQRNGYATEAVGLVVDHLFETTRKAGITAYVFEFNDGSRTLLERLGFQKEGRLRNAYFTGGEHVDMFVFGLLREEWTG